ncbi:DUF2155 domain-containing protein [Rickettsiales bacterium]|nr:DUF2155 domain-containing protein [Rickettsiales bacterium]
MAKTRKKLSKNVCMSLSIFGKYLAFFALFIFWQNSYAQNLDNDNLSKNYTKGVKLHGLNKITTEVITLDVNVDEHVKFGNLEVATHKCWRSSPEEEPENKALLSIWEHIPGEEKKRVFYGWMFSSTPGISALEHPVYDISLLECHNKL